MTLRLVDAGTVSPWRSQALWHGIAAAMRPDALPTLSFCRPSAPYVGLGYHRFLDEIDLDACRRLGLPVIRRQIGGGPVYLDADQLFFQVTLGAERAPARVDRLYEQCLEPAVAAFRALGLAARRDGLNDIAVGEQPAARKISGTGAGRIGDGVTVVGNVLFRFPHRRMVEILALPGDSLRRECLRLMRRHVSSLATEGLDAVSFGQVREALTETYGRAFGGPCVEDSLTPDEEAAVRQWEGRFQDPAWLAGAARSPRRAVAPRAVAPRAVAPRVRQIKISADAWVVAASEKGLAVEATIVAERMEKISVEARGDSGAQQAMARTLLGCETRPAALRRALAPFAETGRRVADLLQAGLRGRG